MSGSAARALVPALVVLGLVGVVAIAANGSTETGTSRVRPPSATLLDTILNLGLLGVVAGAVLLVYGLTRRKDIAREIASGRIPRVSIVGWGVFVVAFALLSYWRLGDWMLARITTDMPAEPPFPGAMPPPEDPEGTPGTTYEPGVAWLPVAIVLVLVAAVVTGYLLLERRARNRIRERDPLAADLAAVLDETLDDLRAEIDPRRAVIAAYARLERVLAARGLPRRRSETEEEYLARMLRALEVPAGAARRLTTLFERATFSPHAVKLEMKEEAIGALEKVRDELRGASDASTAVAAALSSGASS